MGEFPSCFPDGCPQNAAEVSATLYRGCDDNPSSEEDFTPHACSDVPRKRRMAANGSCLGFGLSVWVSEDDARHAQELFAWASRKHIFVGSVVPDDGRLAPTATEQQPAHHSFWAYGGVDIKLKFSPALPPLRNGR